VIVYAESSAVLSWLLGERRAAEVAVVLDEAELVLTSVLTGVECSRALVRGATAGTLGRADARLLAETLAAVEATWHLVEVGDRVRARAGAPLPVEPVRALDALHLASAALVREEYGGVAVLSLDDRIRVNAAAMGMQVLP